MFKPKGIFYEKEIENYELGKYLLKKYEDTPKVIIENHNNIEEMRKRQNKDFMDMKRNLIIGVRKTHNFVPNHKTSDYLVPYTSSGCTAACMYCYLVCNYNKCAYLRLFVNREKMLDKIIKTAQKSDKALTFEIGSNSDLILENTITNNLPWTIENFKNTPNGRLTFPTKFDMVDDILNVDHNGKVTIRMSVNPEEIINKVEFGTSRLKGRIEAINKLKEAGYEIGILIAPVIMVENWKELYLKLIQELESKLSPKVKKDVFFEIIFMTYSFVHTKINEEAFPNAINLYNKEIMTGRGKGKYMYKADLRKVKFAVGLCFQYPEYQIFEDTVFDEIAFGPKQMALDTDEIQSRVFESMNIVGLDRKLKDASPFDMSGGQKRRVAIASIIAMKPQVLVLDEPCAGLDPKGRQVILNLVKNYQKKMGNTVLFVSHSMEDVANIADKVMVFKNGQVAMFGAVDEVFSRGAELKEMGLNIPEVTEVFLKLKAMGVDCNTGVYTVDQAVKEIKRLKSEGESSYAF